MNISDLKVTFENMDVALGDWSSIRGDLEIKIKKKINNNSTFQFGQIQQFLHPWQMVRLLNVLDRPIEASLIHDWFIVDGIDIGGMLGVIPGAWNIDRIVKYICKNKTLNFEWIDRKEFVAGVKKFYGIDVVTGDMTVYECKKLYSIPVMYEDFSTYSKSLSKQFSQIFSVV